MVEFLFIQHSLDIMNINKFATHIGTLNSANISLFNDTLDVFNETEVAKHVLAIIELIRFCENIITYYTLLFVKIFQVFYPFFCSLEGLAISCYNYFPFLVMNSIVKEFLLGSF